MIGTIRAKVAGGERLSREDGVYLLREARLLDLAPLAMEVRYRFNPEHKVTFVIDTNLNYTNVCDVYCNFCAFYRRSGQDGEYSYTIEEMMEQFARAG
jgi:cyclic dehypoxanthinyl futalosine synthase